MLSQPKQKLLPSMRANLRLRHFSSRTEEAYVGWVRRFVKFHRLEHPDRIGEAEVTAFLTHLAVERRVAPSTLTQALAALQFLYREIVRQPLSVGSVIPRPRSPVRLPVVLTPDEVRRVLGELRGTHRLIGMLLYGSGLRLLECLTLRIKDLDLDRGEIRLRRGKGAKDRVTVLAEVLRRPLWDHLLRMKALHDRDLADGGGWVEMPGGLEHSTPTPAGPGPGSGSFRRVAGTQSEPAADAGAIISTSRRCNGRCRRPRFGAGSASGRPVTASGIRSRPTCSRRAPTFGPCRSCWGIGMCRRRCCTLTSSTEGGWAYGVPSIRQGWRGLRRVSGLGRAAVCFQELALAAHNFLAGPIPVRKPHKLRRMGRTCRPCSLTS